MKALTLIFKKINGDFAVYSNVIKLETRPNSGTPLNSDFVLTTEATSGVVEVVLITNVKAAQRAKFINVVTSTLMSDKAVLTVLAAEYPQ